MKEVTSLWMACICIKITVNDYKNFSWSTEEQFMNYHYQFFVSPGCKQPLKDNETCKRGKFSIKSVKGVVANYTRSGIRFSQMFEWKAISAMFTYIKITCHLNISEISMEVGASLEKWKKWNPELLHFLSLHSPVNNSYLHRFFCWKCCHKVLG